MMAGLVSYASSDEEDENNKIQTESPVSKAAVTHPAGNGARDPEPRPDQLVGPSLPQGPLRQSNTPLGPSLPPPESEALTVPYPVNNDTPSAPGSPYTANRAMLHDLTLPSHPNFDIPQSPPGSPPRETTKKFEQFLELKKKGVHFNSKLEDSDALQNPSLTDKLMGFVGIQGAEQYENTLQGELWDSKAAPAWAYRESLRRTHEKIAKEKDEERTNGTRTSVDFVKPVSSGGR